MIMYKKQKIQNKFYKLNIVNYERIRLLLELKYLRLG